MSSESSTSQSPTYDGEEEEEDLPVSHESKWSLAPFLVMTQIFDYLEPQDRYKASIACKNWRPILFQKKFFTEHSFTLDLNNGRQMKFFRDTMCHLSTDLTILFDLTSVFHMDAIRRILNGITHAERLDAVRFRAINDSPSGTLSNKCIERIENLFLKPLKGFLGRTKGGCRVLDFGCNNTLVKYAVELFNSLEYPERLEVLTLATLQSDVTDYSISRLDGIELRLCPFLQVLSMDYDNLNDEFVGNLYFLRLTKFLICVHGLDHMHPGITELTWSVFAITFPNIDLIVTLAYTRDAVAMLRQRILCSTMPLTHLRVQFCDALNVEALEWLSMCNPNTLKSIHWVDSSYKTTEKSYRELHKLCAEDPFVMLAWRCKSLEEIIVHGYMMDFNNLVGIARLRSRVLKRLEVSMVEGQYTPPQLKCFRQEISRLMGRPWQLAHVSELHDALGDKEVSDDVRDDYVLTVMKSDLKQ